MNVIIFIFDVKSPQQKILKIQNRIQKVIMNYET